MTTRRKNTKVNVEAETVAPDRAERCVWREGDVQIIKANQPVGAVTAKTPRKDAPKPCECGCGRTTKGGKFVVGHDAKRKSSLLTAARAGDDAARAELLERGWATADSIDNAKAKLNETERAERRLAKLEAKLAKARATVAELEAQIGAAQAAPAS